MVVVMMMTRVHELNLPCIRTSTISEQNDSVKNKIFYSNCKPFLYPKALPYAFRLKTFSNSYSRLVVKCESQKDDSKSLEPSKIIPNRTNPLPAYENDDPNFLSRSDLNESSARRNIDSKYYEYENGDECIPELEQNSKKKEGSDLRTLFQRFVKVSTPYWTVSEDKVSARVRLAGVFALTLATTGISVGFNFLGRDFYNALSNKDVDEFTRQLCYYLAAFIGGIPVFVMRDFFRDKLALQWRAWMTSDFNSQYFKNRTFYDIQSQSLVDNPDQRIVDDVDNFTRTALTFSLALFNSFVDLISFSGILYGIYPPLFFVLIVYSIAGTALSVYLGKDLVVLNFLQEKREADFRYGLVRVRENAESIAFYAGEANETATLMNRFKQLFENYSTLLVTSRNLQFFTSGYRYVIQVLPAAVVAPLYFSGKIEFGVINQSFSAFNHILSDFSIVVYQFQALSAFSAVVDRLGEFSDVLDERNGVTTVEEKKAELIEGWEERPTIVLSNAFVPRSETTVDASSSLSPVNGEETEERVLLHIQNLTLYTPQYSTALVENLSIRVKEGEHLLIMGPSGSGKTSLLRAIAGLWKSGEGSITRYIDFQETSYPASPNNSAIEPPLDQPASTNNDNNDKNDNKQTNSVAKDGNLQEELGMKDGEVMDAGGLIFFVPQRPYMVLGTLRQQLLYPTWSGNSVYESKMSSVAAEKETKDSQDQKEGDNGIQGDSKSDTASFLPWGRREKVEEEHNILHRPIPSDNELLRVLKRVSLSHLAQRCNGLDAYVDWSSVLSLGEQQRIAFARLLLSKPKLALMDESTSALDEENEAKLYADVEASGVTFVSIGHRSTLQKFHTCLLRLNEPSDEEGKTWTLSEIQTQS